MSRIPTDVGIGFKAEKWRSALIRLVLKHEQWKRNPGKEGDPGRSGEHNRLFLEAVL
jgi:hypothetical protein